MHVRISRRLGLFIALWLTVAVAIAAVAITLAALQSGQTTPSTPTRASAQASPSTAPAGLAPNQLFDGRRPLHALTAGVPGTR